MSVIGSIYHFSPSLLFIGVYLTLIFICIVIDRRPTRLGLVLLCGHVTLGFSQVGNLLCNWLHSWALVNVKSQMTMVLKQPTSYLASHCHSRILRG